MEKRILGLVSGRENYTGFESPNRYLDGYLGEFGFRGALKEAGKRFVYQVKADGKSGKSDFQVWINGKQTAVEVKTRQSPKAEHFRRNESQWDRSSVISVGVRMCEDRQSVEIMGWLWTADLMNEETATQVHGMWWEEFEGGRKARAVPFKRMFPAEWLFAILDAADVVGSRSQAGGHSGGPIQETEGDQRPSMLDAYDESEKIAARMDAAVDAMGVREERDRVLESFEDEAPW